MTKRACPTGIGSGRVEGEVSEATGAVYCGLSSSEIMVLHSTEG